ncbi:MAG: DUF389 domain-containing protein [Synechococcales cyanobacterium M58_A2018_015]|nr:DUF389 domain-containing protein [Synechococcales cyanobacterium M58_A2018_015]
MWFSFKRGLVRSRQFLEGITKSNSGEWKWLTSKPVPLPSLNRSLWRSAEPSLSFYVLLSLSGAIATFGLLANSAATIIGAMIVAPLMGPILGIAFSVVMGNRRLLKRSLLSVVTGVLLVILIGLAICRLTGLNTLTPEIQGRTAPTLLDLGVALAAGTAGAYAKSRRDISDALPGVAIAVALVPPLSVVGIGIAYRLPTVTGGSLLLFLTNLVGIIFSGSAVFLLQRYGSIARAKRGLIVAFTSLAVLAIPLGLSFQDLVVEQRIRDELRRIVAEETRTFAERDIRRFEVRRRGNRLLVSMDVATQPGSITDNQVQLVRDYLQQQLGRPVSLEVTLIPVETLQAE